MFYKLFFLSNSFFFVSFCCCIFLYLRMPIRFSLVNLLEMFDFCSSSNVISLNLYVSVGLLLSVKLFLGQIRDYSPSKVERTKN